LRHYFDCYEKINCVAAHQIVVLDFKDHDQIKDGYVFTLNPNEPLPRKNIKTMINYLKNIIRCSSPFGRAWTSSMVQAKWLNDHHAG